ncbi:RimJ/RimL family protein N-acetyltransferase [Sediminihabitans luteus]|uniref:RimJ/RimL family protein N-acetyltransferase n=1 Tax=Sediminihabitans luteus TaxID=1138585 RepID=A0A2M9CYZ9_9CELL|nr:GNAT family protein [Sediminihabitans luteus]PJJ77164.1 RimJ/RimL family protein N-acetyltransferase [Sediminihabitans luteus]GII98612.1 GCN5 family N-acetyltransferase [Sediminihabitans luteus]
MDLTAPVTLTGRTVELVPLSHEHHAGLVEAARDGESWRLWYTSAPSPEGMTAEIDRRLALAQAGSMLPFTVVRRETGEVGGMTTYMNVDATHRRVEIGSTWLRLGARRTSINTEAKLLLLRHAFEELRVNAVELRTHWHNQQSRAVIERLGARLDGVLRNHMVLPDGSLRDTVVYSILPHEWPAVRNGLRAALDRHA